MRRFKSISKAQRFLALQGPIQSQFRIGRRQFTIDCFVAGHSLLGARRRVSTELNGSGRGFGPSTRLQPLI